jgi:hypothetical protein
MMSNSRRTALGSIHFWLIIVLVIWSAPNQGYGIAYWNADSAIVELATNKEPPDLFHPDRMVTARVGNSGGAFVFGSSAVIAPNWIITANHVLEALDELNVLPGFRPGGGAIEYRTKLGQGDEPMIYHHPTLDIGLVRIVDVNGNDANLQNWLSIREMRNNARVTLGGNGYKYRFDEQTNAPTFVAAGGSLRWGRNVATLSGTSVSANMDHPTSSDYVKYEGMSFPGDSGMGWFFRDGWEWRLGAVGCCGGSLDSPGPRTSSGTYVGETGCLGSEFKWNRRG